MGPRIGRGPLQKVTRSEILCIKEALHPDIGSIQTEAPLYKQSRQEVSLYSRNPLLRRASRSDETLLQEKPICTKERTKGTPAQANRQLVPPHGSGTQ